MCGRYESAVNKEELDSIFSKYIGKLHIDYDIDEVLIEENIRPTDKIRVIVLENGEYKVKVMKWAIRSIIFNPASKDRSNPYMEKDIFNSKIETITKSTNWKPLFEKSRCLIPMTAFYEWPVINGIKKPQRITVKNEKIIFAGGIFKDKDTRDQKGASIITCEPNTFIKPLHNRMPLIFTADQAGAFLNMAGGEVAAICKPLDNEIEMEMNEAKI